MRSGVVFNDTVDTISPRNTLELARNVRVLIYEHGVTITNIFGNVTLSEKKSRDHLSTV